MRYLVCFLVITCSVSTSTAQDANSTQPPMPVEAHDAPRPIGEYSPITPQPTATPLVTVPAVGMTNPSTPDEQPTAAVSNENSIFFLAGLARIDDAGNEKLRGYAKRLIQNRKATVVLVGHTDWQGSQSYNIAITEERLMAVERTLRSYGVPLRQIRRNRTGSVKHPPRCATEECRQQQRRVELRYVP